MVPEELVKLILAFLIVAALVFALFTIYGIFTKGKESTEKKDLTRIVLEINDLKTVGTQITVPVFSEKKYEFRLLKNENTNNVYPGCNKDYCACFIKDSTVICETFDIKKKEFDKENLCEGGNYTLKGDTKSTYKLTFIRSSPCEISVASNPYPNQINSVNNEVSLDKMKSTTTPSGKNIYYFVTPLKNMKETTNPNTIVLRERIIDNNEVNDRFTITDYNDEEIETDGATADAIIIAQDENEKDSTHMLVSRDGNIFVAVDEKGYTLMDNKQTSNGDNYFLIEIIRTKDESGTPLNNNQKAGFNDAINIFKTYGVTKYSLYNQTTGSVTSNNDILNSSIQSSGLIYNPNFQSTSTIN